jgi:hypothetical protein
MVSMSRLRQTLLISMLTFVGGKMGLNWAKVLIFLALTDYENP